VLDVSEHLGDQPEHGNRRLAAVPVGIAVRDQPLSASTSTNESCAARLARRG
jgi:hypothetical protein